MADAAIAVSTGQSTSGSDRLTNDTSKQHSGSGVKPDGMK